MLQLHVLIIYLINGKPFKKTFTLFSSFPSQVSETISKKWLLRLKRKLGKKVSLNWDRVNKGSAKALFPLCAKHMALANSFSICGLCRRKLALGSVVLVTFAKEEITELNGGLRADGIPSELHQQSLICKLCKTFCSIKLKWHDAEYLKANRTHKSFYKDYRKKLYSFLGLHNDGYSTEGSLPSPKKIHQVRQSDNNPTKITIKMTTLEANASGASTASGAPPAPSMPSSTAGVVFKEAATPSTSSSVVLEPRERRKRHKQREFASPNSEARIHVDADGDEKAEREGANDHTSNSSSGGGASGAGKSSPEKCSVNIQFDLNTKRLWQDLHFPYGIYTSFFRHLILLEKYWRNGDLALAADASPKASVYIRSVRNRIDAYEGRNRGADYLDLSASTRPDLSVPADPDGAADYDGEDEEDAPSPPQPTAKRRKEHSTISSSSNPDTILRIPKVTVSSPAQTSTSDNSAITSSATVSPTMPTKIRVRTDLMHLGLMANENSAVGKEGKAGSNSCAPSRSDSSFKIADLVAPKPASSNQPRVQSNLLQLLNDPPKKASSSSAGPLLGNTSLIGSNKSMGNNNSGSNNSQLFKSSGSGGDGSGSGSAIPLTFNNSIAEVLAAANKASKQKELESAGAATANSGSKPDVTITPKPLSGSKHGSSSTTSSRSIPATVTAKSSSSSSSPTLLSQQQQLQKQTQQLQQQLANAASGKLTAADMRAMQKLWSAEEELRSLMAKAAAANNAASSSTRPASSSLLTSPSPSGGVSIQKSPAALKNGSSSAAANINSSTGVSDISRLNPLVDMNRLLQTQSPGVAPHIVAQSTMPPAAAAAASAASVRKTPTRIAPKPVPAVTASSTAAVTAAVRPVQLGTGASKPPPQAVQGIQTVNKKSLNTVLDRLSGMKAPSSASATAVTATSSASNSNLVQQLQAPPMSSIGKAPPSLPSSPSSPSSSLRSIKSASSTTSSDPAAAHNAALAALAANPSAFAAGLTNPFGLHGFPPTAAGMVGQPMVQYPTAATAAANSWAAAQQAQAAQQAALLMAASGGVPGMSHAQAAAAMQELMKMSMSKSGPSSSTTTSSLAGVSSSRSMRAPPPLTHMGRGPNGAPTPSAKPNTD